MYKIIKLLKVLLERTKELAISKEMQSISKTNEQETRAVEINQKVCQLHWNVAKKGCQRADKRLAKAMVDASNKRDKANKNLAFLNSI